MRGEQVNRSTSHFSHEDIFYKHFPYYLSIGMTYTQYWEQDSCLVKYYRQAEEIRTERLNQQLWLQGMYIYDGLLRVSPILRAFAKNGTKPKPYIEEPYPINKRAEDKNIQKQKALSYLEMYMAVNNKKFEKGSD